MALSFVATDEVPESRAPSGTANPGADAYSAMHSATLPHLRRSIPTTAFAVPETTTGSARSDEAGHVKSPHSPTTPMFSAKYDDDGVTGKASAVDSSG